MHTRLFPIGLLALLVILTSCGVMGDPIPYTQTESYRRAHDAQNLPADSQTKPEEE